MSDSSDSTRIKKKKVKPKKAYLSIFRKILLITAIIGTVVSIVLVIYLASILGTLDSLDPKAMENYQQTSFVYDYQDNVISSIHGIENRITIPFSEIPPYVRDAFISVEDIRFEKHPGFDIQRMFGSLLQNIKAGKIVAGAGTITQQVIRNTVLTKEQTVTRKIKEIFLAYQLEKRYSKDQILEMYLNIIYFAKGAYGIEAASKTYFGKSTSELTVAEGALLAGIIKNPNRNSPFIDMERSLERKDLSIDLMVKNDKLTPEEGEAAKKQEIKFAEETKPTYTHGFFMDMVTEEAASRLGVKQEDLYTGGYRIYTTMNNQLQEYAEELYTHDDLFPKSPVSGETSESALVVLDTATGELRAILGGREYPEGQRKILNRANSKRQPGSSIKPIIDYSPAIENGRYTTVTFIEDAPVTFGNYSPSNYGGKFYGMVTVRNALARSINIPAVKILKDIGINQGIANAERMGIEFTAGDRNNLAIALGGMEKGVSPIDLTRAYTALGDRGSYKDYTTIRRIEDSNGRVLYEYRLKKTQVLSEETAFIVSNMLQSSTATGGTASRLKNLNLAAKTGTVQLPNTKEYANINGTNDAWIVAYNPEYTVTVWMGFDRRTTETYLPPDATGGKYPADIVKSIINFIYDGKQPPGFTKPLGVVDVKLDGKALWEQNRVLLASPMTPDDYVVTEYFTRNTVPTETSDYWVVPNQPYNFNVTLNLDGFPVISFTPRDTYAAYNIQRTSATDETPIFLQQISTGTLDPVEWIDTQVLPGESYGYFVVPVHTEMKLAGAFVEGPPTQTIYIQIPALEVKPNDTLITPGFEDLPTPDNGTNSTNQDNPPGVTEKDKKTNAQENSDGINIDIAPTD